MASLNAVKKIAIVIIVASIVVGSAFGLIATSTTIKNHVIAIGATVIFSSHPVTCPSVPTNSSIWAQLYVNANQTDLNLISMTALSPIPSISLTISLNQTSSAYVYYHRYNITTETVSVPLPSYWKAGQDIDLSVNYYYSGPNPTAPADYPIGSTKVNTSSLYC